MQAGKHPQAIATKVLPPRCVGLIERPRLLELVTQVEMKPLSAIKAGAANYGVGLALSGRPRMTEHSGALPMSARPPVRIDVLSDVVCPWCFIGKRRLERAIAMKPEIPVEVHWRPYFLNDWIPREGISREQYLTTKFGSPERYKGIAQRVAATVAQEGLVYAIDKISNQPNTTDAHRLIRWAAGIGKAAEMEQRLMDLYFTEGADLTKKAVLVQAAADVGLDPEDARAALDSDKDVEEVTREAQSAKEAAIEGVPYFIFGGRLAVSGAQSPEYLAEAIERADQARTAPGANSTSD